MSKRATQFGTFCLTQTNPLRDASCRGQVNGTAPANNWAVDLASLILRRSIGALGHDRDGCSGCRRIPVAGEVVHTFESGRVLCSLCLAGLPEAERSPLRSERVHVGDRRLSVMPKAA